MICTFCMTGITGVIPAATRELDGQNIEHRMIVSATGKPVNKLTVDEYLADRDEALRGG